MATVAPGTAFGPLPPRIQQFFILLRDSAREDQPWSPAMQMLRRFLKDEAGATAIEYGLIAALVGVVIITGLTFLGPSLSNTFQDISTCVDDPNAC
jgi:pilus assembly protein Flp/PilA